MLVIGLCGGSGSGKGTVCSIFSKHGIPSIDTDAVYRELTASDTPCVEALKESFGNEIISENGSLNRKALAKLVFCNNDAKEKLRTLNKISHKFILEETRSRLKVYNEEGYKAVIIDAPVLFESDFDKECDIIISVIADNDIRLSRIMTRDNIDENAATARITAQLSNDKLIAQSNIVIENNSDFIDLEKRINEVVDLLKNYTER